MGTHHPVESDFGTGKKTFSVYLTGIVLCVILTLIPFGAVMYGNFSRGANVAIIYIAAVIQFLIQVVCFLRLNTQTEQGKMNVMSLLLTGVILAAVVIGSLWVMYNLNYNMMN